MEPDLIAYFTQLLGAIDTQGRQLVQGFLTLTSASTNFCGWLPDLYEHVVLGDVDLAIKFIIDALDKKGLVHDPNLNP